MRKDETLITLIRMRAMHIAVIVEGGNRCHQKMTSIMKGFDGLNV